jgi:glycosyltransferase involved in cell wall biosynthesis
MKNILMIDLGRQYGGAEKVIEHIISHVYEDKYKLYLLCVKGSSFYDKNKGKGYGVLTVPYNKRLFFVYFPICIYYIFKYKIQIIHCNGFTGLVLGTICGRILGKKVITTVHSRSDLDRDNCKKSKAIAWLELKLLKLNHCCIVVSNYLKSYFINRGMKDKKLITIYNNISDAYKDSPSSDKDPQRTDKFLICSAGRLEKVKGHIYLVKAMKKLLDKGRNVECFIAGEGSYRSEIQSYIYENSIQDKVKLVGFVDNIREFIKGCDLLIVPSIMESFGLVVLEAMREKKCVIASNVGGIPELIEDNQSGYLVEAGIEDQLYDKIISCYENQHIMASMGESAYRRYMSVWLKYNMTEEYLKVYDSFLNDGDS